MKYLYLSLLICLFFTSACQKQQTPNVVKNASHTVNYKPLVFNSIEDLQNELNAMRDDSPIRKSSIPYNHISDFSSYAETVMQEDGYDDKPSAIISDIFGSILNPLGEVCFENYMLKVCDYGLLYSFIDQHELLCNLADKPLSDLKLSRLQESCPIKLNDPSKIFTVNGVENVYVYDTFGLIVGSNNSNEATITTKAATVEYQREFKDSFSLFGHGANWGANYTIPNASNQKVIFPNNSKIANDTKIYKVDFGVYDESGIKTKTMKKGAFGIWNKFKCKLKTTIGSLVIRENWSNNIDFSSVPYGWVEISTVKYEGKNFTIVTKKTKSDNGLPIPNSQLIQECNQALSWAKSLGLNINSIDGIRTFPEDGNYAYVRIKDKVEYADDSKLTSFFNIEYGGTYETAKNPLYGGNALSQYLQAKRGGYEIYGVYMSGESNYDGYTRGSQMFYSYNAANL